MNCKKATESYERWLGKRTKIIEADLLFKHQQMSRDIFSFMRATFYRWCELLPASCPELAQAPVVLAIGDLHVENFGTWRDAEGRLVWGINDFDEAYSLPYTNDLVRLAVSAHLAISLDHLVIRPGDACAAIIAGYEKGLQQGGDPFILSERHEWLRTAVMTELRDPDKFWKKLNALPTIESGVPAKAKRVLAAALPEPLECRLVHRIAGLGSLGRERFAALAEWRGGLIAREAKALVPSACIWVNRQKEYQSRYEKIVREANRCADPFLQLSKEWVTRRLAPDCSRVELAMLPKGRDEFKLLEAMGRETANVHLGSKRAIEKVQRDLNKRSAGWLHDAAKAMVRATTEDWQTWCS
jgi:hypothetical protein